MAGASLRLGPGKKSEIFTGSMEAIISGNSVTRP